MSAAAISIQNLEVTYNSRRNPALAGINLEVKKGEFVLLAGPSGCGKTTLIRCLNGIIPHLMPAKISGGINLNGKPATEMRPQEISTLAGSVFQDPRAQFFHINVTDEIAFGPENMGYAKPEIRRRVDEAFRRFGIDHLRDKKMFDLSSGEKQKVIFAAVHAMGPDIYILDEPSSNLDAEAIGHLRDILRELKNAGRTVVIVEHRLYYLAGLFDRMLILDCGGIAKEVSGVEALPEAERKRYGLRSLQEPHLPTGAAALPAAGVQAAPAATAGVRAGRAEAHCSGAARAKAGGNSASLKVDGLCFRYPHNNRNALESIAAVLPAGAKTAIIGPNGSGKTTFIKILTGLLHEKTGSISCGPVLLTPAKRFKKCGFVMQESGHQLFFPTVREELASGFGKAKAEDVSQLLEALDLSAVAEAHPQTLSGGQQQRLVIGTALARRPGVLVLDEPTSGLDAAHMLQLAALLDKEAARDATVVIVTHDIEFIRHCCDYVLPFNSGKAAALCPVTPPE